MFEYEASGKTINKAIEAGVEALGVDKDEVDIRVIQDAGFLKKAKILLMIPDEIAEKSEAIRNIIKLKKLEEKISLEEQNITKNSREKDGILGEINTNLLNNELAENSVKTADSKLGISALSAGGNSWEKEQILGKNLEVLNTIPADASDTLGTLKNFLLGFVKASGFVAEVEVFERENDIFAKMTGDGLGKLIGHQGETLASVQYILNIYLGKFSRKTKRVIVDINNFKEKRKETLEGLAHRLAKRVQETGKRMELEPMNAYERLVIHSVIATYPELATHSEGVEPKRFLVIESKE